MSNQKDRSSLQDWHRQDVMSAIRKREFTLAELARINGCKPATAYNVFHRPYPRIERIIAHFLEMEPQDIWPSRYANRTTKNSGVFGANKNVA